jgi:hypothetical protein
VATRRFFYHCIDAIRAGSLTLMMTASIICADGPGCAPQERSASIAFSAGANLLLTAVLCTTLFSAA